MIVDLSDLGDGEIRVLKPGVIVCRMGDKIVAFSRYCPHEGADLSLGQVERGQLFCPWHNLCFDSAGRQPCTSLANLRRYGVVSLAGGRYVIAEQARLEP